MQEHSLSKKVDVNVTGYRAEAADVDLGTSVSVAEPIVDAAVESAVDLAVDLAVNSAVDSAVELGLDFSVDLEVAEAVLDGFDVDDVVSSARAELY